MTDQALNDQAPSLIKLEAEHLLTPAEVAKMIGVSAKTIERWRALATGPAYIKFSQKVIKYRRSDVQKFIQEHVVT